MTSKVEQFRALHTPGNPLVLYNIWDAGSARFVADAGAKAIATGSYGVAEANGFTDGEALPLELVLENLRRILSVTDLPVTIDMEAGYGDMAEEVAVSVGKAAAMGAAGINLEDRMPGETVLLGADEAAERIAAAAGTGLHVNARTDVYRGKDPGDYTSSMIDEVIGRSEKYAAAGAGSLFVPFLGDHAIIRSICEASPLPVNVLWAPGRGTVAELASLGVARISYGHQPWLWLMEKLRADAKELYSDS